MSHPAPSNLLRPLHLPARMLTLAWLRQSGSNERRISSVTAGGWGVSTTTQGFGGPAKLSVYRPLTAAARAKLAPRPRLPWCHSGDLDGQWFPSSDAAFAAALERGYTQPYRRGACWPVALTLVDLGDPGAPRPYWSLEGDRGNLNADERRALAAHLGLPHMPRDRKRRRVKLMLLTLRAEQRRRNDALTPSAVGA